MKLTTLAAASVLAATAGSLAAQSTGVSRPEDLNDTISVTTAPVRKPSPVATVSLAPVLQSQPIAAAPKHTSMAMADPRGFIVSDDPTSGVVMAQPTRPNELPEGTLIHVALDDTLSTARSRRGQEFTAHLSSNVMHEDRVLLPAGSVVRGRITEVRQAKRFHAGAMMRLQPDTITLPDGTRYTFTAQVIDFDRMSDAAHNSRINDEGEIISNSHTGPKIAGVALTTGSAAVAGAVIGGGFGALVGAGIGAGVGVIWWGKQDHSQVLDQGTVMILNLGRPLFVGTETAMATTGSE